MPLKVVEQVLTLYRERYFDLNVCHFHERLTEEHRVHLSYSWVKSCLQSAGLVACRRKRGTNRTRRPRRLLPGMLLFQDGSRHAWIPGIEPVDLVVVLDDATSEVYQAQFVPEENTRICLEQLKAVVEQKGVFCALYTDKGSHFVTTRHGHSPHRPQSAQGPTQIERALKELGGELIAANSPQPRGRMERFFGTWQGCLPQELRLRGIDSWEQANRFLKRVWIAKHNRTWTVPAAQKGNAFAPSTCTDLNRVFSIQHEWVVAADNTIQFGNVLFQIEPFFLRVSFVKCRVKLYEHLNGKIEIDYGPHTLGWYRPDGRSLKTQMAQVA